MDGKAIRFTRTFTETQENLLVGGEWHVSRVSALGIDEMINEWVRSTENVIISVFSSVEHSSVQDGRYTTKLRYIVTYMEQAAFLQYEGREMVPVVVSEKIPGVHKVTGGAGAPSQAQIAEAVRQVAAGKLAKHGISGAAAEKMLATMAVPATYTPDAVVNNSAPEVAQEEAKAWQEAEGANPVSAREEAQRLANELTASVTKGAIPTRTQAANRVTSNPTPPILVPTPPTQNQPKVQTDAPASLMAAIPTRRKLGR